jgi:uncharacterized protein YggU (UPF0235/DUF167 family)
MSRITGWRNGILCIALAAPPVDGKANDELIRFLSSLLDIPKNRIRIDSGIAGRMKRLSFDAVSAEDVRKFLLPTLF